MSSREGGKSLFIKAFGAFAIFFCTAIFSAVFFSSLGFVGSADAADSNTQINVNVSGVISLRLMKNNADITELNLSATPVSGGSFVKDNLSAVVSTSNATGYTLTMANNDDNTALVHTNNTITTTIPSITTLPTEATNTTTESNFPVNSWGYSLQPMQIEDTNNPGTFINNSAQTFSRIPTSSATDTIKETITPTTEDETKVTFATKVDNTIVAGTYHDTIVFSATTNYVPTITTMSDIRNMQEMTPEICANSQIGDEAILTDTRDNNTYVVRKLADNRCWMVQNLRLGSTGTAIRLTSADSDILEGDFVLPRTSSLLDYTDTTPKIITEKDAFWADGFDIQSSGIPPSQTQYLGVYYNWWAASAGGITHLVPNKSVCPKGWRLPAVSGEAKRLYDSYESYDAYIDATSTILSGHYSSTNHTNNGFLGAGYSGEWWGNGSGDSFSVNRTGFKVSGLTYYHEGAPVRCIANSASSFPDISTMQEMTSEICANVSIGDEKILRDTRDDNTYAVRKLKDGKCWMVQNLRLGTKSDGSGATIVSDITLTSADSDVSANFIISASAIQSSNTTSWGYDETRVFNNGNSWIAYDKWSSDIVKTSGVPPSQSRYIGNYYNWYTATAGTGTRAISNGEATGSICPKGWKLPTAGSSTDDFNGMTNATVNTATNVTNSGQQSFMLQNAPYYFILSGHYSNEAYQGSSGNWWSSRTDGANAAYVLYLNGANIQPQSSFVKNTGFSVRCLAR